MAQAVKNLPGFYPWEDSLEKETATHSSILAWKISWTEDPGRLLSGHSHAGRKESDTTERLTLSLHLIRKYFQNT